MGVLLPYKRGTHQRRKKKKWLRTPLHIMIYIGRRKGLERWGEGVWEAARYWCKLQALVYDILPSPTAVFSYTIGPRKMSANEQFFVGAQTVVSLLQTTQIISDICFITNHVAYTSSNKAKIGWIETELFFLPRADAPHVYMCAWVLGCFDSHISTQTFRRVLTTSVDSCTEIKSAPSVA